MDTLARLEAIEAIKTVKARYFRAVDTKDAAQLHSVLTADAIADYRGSATDPSSGINAVPGATEQVNVGRDVIVEQVMAAVAPLVTVHHGSIPEVEITSDTTARAIWPMVDRLRMPAGSPITEMVGYGHYFEEYRREPDGWKIATLRLPRLRVDVTEA